MDTPNVLLAQYAEQAGISINRLARECDLNKGMLSTVLKGGKPLPEDWLQKILASTLFTSEQGEQLRLAFYSGYYGAEPFKRMLFFKNTLAKMARGPSPAPAVIPFAPPGDMQALTCDGQIYGAVRFILENELALTEPRIDTNYPFTAEKLDDLVYTILRGSANTLRFRHVLRMEYNGGTIINLRNLLGAVRYFRLGHNLYHCYCPHLKCEYDSIYPCFFLTSRHALLFHPDHHHGLFLNNAEVVDTITHKSMHQYFGYEPLGSFRDSATELTKCLPEGAIPFPEGLRLGLSEGGLYLGGDNFNIAFPNNTAVQDFKNLGDYVERNGFTCSGDGPLNAWEDMADKCYMA